MPGRLRVLLSAYACEPGKGSEPAVGWGLARELAKYHDIWVLTRANNRPAIEAELARTAGSRFRVLYYDLPGWARWWKRGQRGVHFYYYLWQLGALFAVRRIHRRTRFDLVHHVTFVNYWLPSFLWLLGVPFVWGPVGGGDSSPILLRGGMGFGGRAYEILRDAARWLGEQDPFVGLATRRSIVAFGTTEATAHCLRRLGAKDVRVLSQVGMSAAEIGQLSQSPGPDAGVIRFVSIGRLLALKGFHFGLRAFARARIARAEYWIIGDGPELGRLRGLVTELGIAGQVRFWGGLPRDETLRRLAESHVLVHPSLHDSGGWVCAEALAIGRPVICLDLGGPAAQVTASTGFRIRPRTTSQVVRDLSEAMQRLAADPALRRQMGAAGRRRCMEELCWESKGRLLDAVYKEIVEKRSTLLGQARSSGKLPDPVLAAHGRVGEFND